MTDGYPIIVPAVIDGEHVDLHAKWTFTAGEVPILDKTTLDFDPADPVMRDGDSFTITTTTRLT